MGATDHSDADATAKAARHARRRRERRQRQRLAQRPAAPGSRLAEAFEAVERFPVLIESRERVIAAATAETARDRRARRGGRVRRRPHDRGAALRQPQRRRRRRRRRHPRGGRGAEALRRAGDRRHRAQLRLLRVQRRLGAEARALPRPRPRHPARRRPDRPRWSAGSNATSSPSPRCCTTSAGSSSPACTRATRSTSTPISRTPEQRLRDERDQLGIDHALVGGVLARRWNLPQRIAVAIERHHADDADGLAAMVATADMVAHYSQGEAISPERLRASAERCGLGPEALRDLLYELPCRARTPPGSASPARSRPASSTSSATSPRAWSTSRSPARCSSRSRRSAPTCTTSTARSAPSTAPRPCSPRATAAGSRRVQPALGASRSAHSRRAIATAWVRFLAPSRASAVLMWVLTVSSLRSSSRAATVVDSPLASSCRIWRWRRVSLPRLPFGGTAGSTKLSWAAAASTACAAPPGRWCGRRRRWRRPAWRRWRGGARGARRGRRCRARARSGAGIRIVSWPLIEADDPVLPPAHVDDRDVEVADVADQVERLPRGWRISCTSKSSSSTPRTPSRTSG